MNIITIYVKFIAIFFILLLISSCAEQHLISSPARMATSQEVYHSALTGKIPTSAPSDSRIKVVYTVSYSDVFRAAKVSAAQAQLFIDKISEKRGYILASRTFDLKPTRWNYNHAHLDTKKLFYYIRIKELKAEKTFVTIYAKIQHECVYNEADTTSKIVSLGFSSYVEDENKVKCNEKSKIRWASGTDKDPTTMESYHNFIRNNLIAAGLL